MPRGGFAPTRKGALDKAAVGGGWALSGRNAEGVAQLVAVVEPGRGDEHGLPLLAPQRHGLVASLRRGAEQHLPQCGRFAKPGSPAIGPPVRQACAHGLQRRGRHRPAIQIYKAEDGAHGLARIFYSLSHRYDHLPASGSYDGGSQGICGLVSKPPLRGEIMRPRTTENSCLAQENPGNLAGLLAERSGGGFASSPDVPASALGPRIIDSLHAGCRVERETSGLGPTDNREPRQE